MDVSSRGARARVQVRAQFEADVLERLRTESAESGVLPRVYVAVQSGNPAANCATPSSGDSLVDACSAAFTDLLCSADALLQTARARLYDTLLLYGEDAEHQLDREDGPIAMMSSFLPFLHELSTFVRAVHRLAENILLQLHAFHNLGQQQQQMPGTKECPMGRVWRALGDLLSVLIVLDELIRAHPFLAQHWAMFLRSVKLVQHNPAQFELLDAETPLQLLNATIAQLDAELMGGIIFKNCCQRICAVNDHLSIDRALLERFRRTIVEQLERWERVPEENVPDKQRLLALLALALLHNTLLPPRQRPDRKLLRSLCSTHKRVIAFHLVGDILFTPALFLAANTTADAIDAKTLATVQLCRSQLLDRQLEQLARECAQFELTVAEWRCKMDDFSDCPPSNGSPLEPTANARCNLLFEGAHIADKMGRLLKCLLNGHLAENRALSKPNARLMFALIQQIKSISALLNAHWPAVLEWTQQWACAHTAGALLQRLEISVRQLNAKQPPNVVAALQIAQLALSRPPERQTILRAGVALEMANYTRTLRQGGGDSIIDEKLGRLDLLWNLGAVLHRVTDMSFLYWHRLSLAEAFCTMLMEQQQPNLQDAKHFFEALNDCVRLFPSAVHCSPEKLLRAFSAEMFAVLRDHFLERLCTEVENDLRISYHAQQSTSMDTLAAQLFPNAKAEQAKGGRNGQQKWPPKGGEEEKTSRLLHLLHLPRFHCGDRIVDVKGYVIAHLEAIFYNLSVIALHDCESYRRMRALAALRYRIQLAEPHLPNISVDQGLDVLAVMRDPDAFVASYCYELNEQFFIEREGQSKVLLNVVRVQQVVNSIRTHGLGILNTLVNSAYKHLRAQFQRLSACLFDERVKSLLTQEIRFYRDAVEELDQRYPVGRAEKLAAMLSRCDASSALGAAEGGSDLLDSLRTLVTRIGNMLGLLRLIRTGFVDFCAPLILMRRSQRAAEEANNGENTTDELARDCARLEERAIFNAWNNLTDTSDCIEMLSSVFAREFRNAEKFAHLRHFFAAVPALSLCAVEHVMAGQARLASGRRAGATIHNHSIPSSADRQQLVFVEDGFSMGVAYVLSLLNQRFFFDSLNWFVSLRASFRAEQAQCARELKEAQRRKDDSLTRVLVVKSAQLEERAAEQRQLECALNSALTFFQANELGGGEDAADDTFLEDF